MLNFQTLLSSSRGNLVTVWTPHTRILIDAGAASQRAMRELLSGLAGPPVQAALISHLHSDHLNSAALKVLLAANIPVYLHQSCRRECLLKFGDCCALDEPLLRSFAEDRFRIGELTIRGFELDHDYQARNFGFSIEAQSGAEQRRLVAATDFCDWRQALPHFIDADLLYVEANHDPDLLDAFPNANSRFHLSNEQAAQLLRAALQQGPKKPARIVLGHLSEKRNRPALALAAVQAALDHSGLAQERTLEILVAPPHEPSQPFAVGGAEITRNPPMTRQMNLFDC